MSDHALKSATSGAGMEITGAGSASYPILVGGKVAPASGKTLPNVMLQKMDLQYLVEKLNIASQTIGHDLHFDVDLDNGFAVIQVLDRETGEIIRQIPSEQALLGIQENGAFEIRLFDAFV